MFPLHPLHLSWRWGWVPTTLSMLWKTVMSSSPRRSTSHHHAAQRPLASSPSCPEELCSTRPSSTCCRSNRRADSGWCSCSRGSCGQKQKDCCCLEPHSVRLPDFRPDWLFHFNVPLTPWTKPHLQAELKLSFVAFNINSLSYWQFKDFILYSSNKTKKVERKTSRKNSCFT